MNSVLIHDFKIPVPGVSRKVLWHFSDIHLALCDEWSTPEEAAKAAQTAASWDGTRLWFSQRYGEPDTDSQRKPAREHFDTLLGLAEGADAVILAGDICDYVCPANLRFLDSRLENLSTPFLAVCGNHDQAEDIPDGYVYSQIKAPVQVLDLGDLLLVGLDDSLRKITKEQNRQFLEILSQEKPVIVVLHIPIMTEGNRELLLECGDYFRLNHPEADDDTLEFIDLLRQNAPQIVALLAGHLHFRNESEIAPGLMQYVSSQGILGNVNRYEIGEVDEWQT